LAFEQFVKPGTYAVSASLNDLHAKQEVTVTKGASISVKLALVKEDELPESGLWIDDAKAADESAASKRNWTPAWILGGITVATFGTSMVFRGLAGGSTNKIESYESELGSSGCFGEMPVATCTDLSSALRRQNTQATVSNATLIASGVLAAATIGYVVYEVSTGEKSAVSASAAYN